MSWSARAPSHSDSRQPSRFFFRGKVRKTLETARPQCPAKQLKTEDLHAAHVALRKKRLHHEHLSVAVLVLEERADPKQEALHERERPPSVPQLSHNQ